MTGPERWALCGEPLYREVGDEVFVLTRDSQMHWLKNDSARFLWDHLVGAGKRGATSAELSAALVDVFDVEDQAALADVSRFVAHLARHGLVSLAPPGHG